MERSRLGPALFQACHHHILAQLLDKKLWGGPNDRWIINSFPVDANVERVGGYRLIQQGMLGVVQHLKRNHLSLFQDLKKDLKLDSMTHRLPPKATAAQRQLPFSQLVVEAYDLLNWFEAEWISERFWQWKNTVAQRKSLELQGRLMRILMENTRPLDPDRKDWTQSADKDSNPKPADPTSLEEPSSPEHLAFEELPKKSRPSDRVMSAFDPDARYGAKGKEWINGYKIQNLCSAQHGVILLPKAIPGSEPDGEAMSGMIHEVMKRHGVKPEVVLGDTAYGWGKHRVQMKELQVKIVAPLAPNVNPTGLFGRDRFIYDAQKDR